MQFDLTALNPVLKELIDNQIVQNTVYKDNPFFALVKKNTSMGGKYFPQPIQTAVGQGGSATWATAQANQTASVFQEFLITPKKDYSFSTIDRLAMLSAKSDKMAFVQALENARDSALTQIKNSLGYGIFGSGTGTIGSIAAISGGSVVTLANASDITKFSVNQTLQASATDGATPRAALGYITAISRSLGQFTLSAVSVQGSVGTPAGWVAGDSLLRAGDSNLKLNGLNGWLPFADPSTSDNWFGVNRSADRVALAGCVYDGSQQSIEEALQDGLNLVSNVGDGSTDYIITHPNSLTNLIKSLGSKVQIVDMMATPTIAFRGVEINGPRGSVKVISDRNCPAMTAFALQMNTWQFVTVGEAPALVEEDGLSMLRSTTQDSYQLQFAAYGNLACNAPGYNGVFKLSV
jgi:hypothetical protein